jgi:hypothetical protein
VDLQVEHIIPVNWNKKAFTSLVADKDTKELITALVTNQLAAETATDLMSGKGAGELHYPFQKIYGTLITLQV